MDFKVSIIIPIYNTEEYVEQCIKSVLNQSYQNLEIILIDDGSTDQSRNICQKLKKLDERIQLFEQKNEGVSKTRNRGIEIATGKYIMFVDSDDLLDKTCVESLLKETKEEAFAICNINRFYQNETNIKIKKLDKKNCYYSREEFIKIYKMELLNSPCGRLYERERIMQKQIRFDEEISLGEDLLFNFEYLKDFKKITLVNQFLYFYRIGNGDSLSKKYYCNMYEIQFKLLNAFRCFFQMNDKNIVEPQAFKFVTTILSNEYYNSNNFFQNNKKVKQLMKDTNIIKEIRNQKAYKNKLEYFLLSHQLYLEYHMLQKIKKSKGI